MSSGANFADRVGDSIPDNVADTVKSAASAAAAFDPIELAHRVGVRSRHAYIGGFASIVLAMVTWSVSRSRPSDDKSQSDRWGIFIGHWAPTFFAVGLALRTKSAIDARRLTCSWPPVRPAADRLAEGANCER